MERKLTAAYYVLALLGILALVFLSEFTLIAMAIGGTIYLLSFLYVCAYRAWWKGKVDLLSFFFAITIVYGCWFLALSAYSDIFSIGATAAILGIFVGLLAALSVTYMMDRGGIRRWWQRHRLRREKDGGN